jgi:hypothetical protein
MAIATKAKAFLASILVQSVVNDMYAGRIAFSITANRSMVADNYKQRAIEMYDVRRAPFLDHYRFNLYGLETFILLTFTQVKGSPLLRTFALHEHHVTFDDIRCLPMEYVSLLCCRTRVHEKQLKISRT